MCHLVDMSDWSLVRSNIRMKPMASLKKAVVRLRNLSCPAVSHSWSWIRWLLPCLSLSSLLGSLQVIFFSLKSIPTVLMNLKTNKIK